MNVIEFLGFLITMAALIFLSIRQARSSPQFEEELEEDEELPGSEKEQIDQLLQQLGYKTAKKKEQKKASSPPRLLEKTAEKEQEAPYKIEPPLQLEKRKVARRRGFQRLERLPPLKKAMVTRELLGKPKADTTLFDDPR